MVRRADGREPAGAFPEEHMRYEGEQEQRLTEGGP